ncbi:hypothetical protein BD309DRAFT_530925 [Dichomitus squalens]|nr:hypothetical protein BD309DRAFT_530925 [Dichomitus squalens]
MIPSGKRALRGIDTVGFCKGDFGGALGSTHAEHALASTSTGYPHTEYRTRIRYGAQRGGRSPLPAPPRILLRFKFALASLIRSGPSPSLSGGIAPRSSSTSGSPALASDLRRLVVSVSSIAVPALSVTSWKSVFHALWAWACVAPLLSLRRTCAVYGSARFTSAGERAVRSSSADGLPRSGPVPVPVG